MSLIEQLGGYRMAKEVMDSIPKDGRSYTITRDDTGIIFNTSELHNALLEHRRQHNIYESGDWVVKACRLKDDTLYQIDEIAESKNYVKTECSVFIDAPMFKHATSEEIKAGHRL